MLFANAAGSAALAYGYMLEWIGPCDHVDTLFKAEVRAYNRTMLAWHAKHPKPL